MTLYVTSDDKRTYVEVSPGVQSGFAVGSHVLHRENCTIGITVINNGKYLCK